MHRRSILIGTLGALFAATASYAQTAAGDVESHVAAARAAAGQEHRATFVHLCLPAAPRGAGPGGGAAGARAGGPPATPDRAAWYAETLDSLPQKYPAVRAALFFNAGDDQTVTAQKVDWRIDADSVIAGVVRRAINGWPAGDAVARRDTLVR